MQLLNQYEASINTELTGSARFLTFDSEQEGQSYTIVFQIKNLQLSDNGKYSCDYHNLHKEINLHVYGKSLTLTLSRLVIINFCFFFLNSEQLDAKDTSLTIINTETASLVPHNDGKVDLQLDKAYQFKCNVNEIYPKPTISFNLNQQPQRDQVKHNEVDRLKNGYYAVSSYSTLDFSVVHSNHGNKFSCVVTPGVPGVQPIVKTVILNVKGAYFIDGLCADEIKLSVENGGESEIACKFFAYPQPTVTWTVLNTNEESTEELDGNNNTKKLESTNDGKYTIELQNESEPGLYRAVLSVKDVSESELKDLTINIQSSQATISRLFKFDHQTQSKFCFFF